MVFDNIEERGILLKIMIGERVLLRIAMKK